MRITTACLTICFSTAVAVAENYTENQVWSEIVTTLRLEHFDDRTNCLASIKRYYSITDNAFSELLVRAAEEFKTGNNSDIRGFAFGSLRYFATTNAIDYAKNEAIHGPSSLNGMKLYGLLTGFDNRCFELAKSVFSSEDPEILLRNRFFAIRCILLLKATESIVEENWPGMQKSLRWSICAILPKEM